MTQRESELIKVTQQVSDSWVPGSCLPVQALHFTARDHCGDRVSQRGLPGERFQNEASPLSWMNSFFLVSEEKEHRAYQSFCDTRSAVKDDEVFTMCLCCAG